MLHEMLYEMLRELLRYARSVLLRHVLQHCEQLISYEILLVLVVAVIHVVPVVPAVVVMLVGYLMTHWLLLYIADIFYEIFLDYLYILCYILLQNIHFEDIQK
jgi:hypothetical protein